MPPFVINVKGSAGPKAVGARMRRIILPEFPIKTGTAPLPLSTTPSMSQKIAGSVGSDFASFSFFFMPLD